MTLKTQTLGPFKGVNCFCIWTYIWNRHKLWLVLGSVAWWLLSFPTASSRNFLNSPWISFTENFWPLVVSIYWAFHMLGGKSKNKTNEKLQLWPLSNSQVVLSMQKNSALPSRLVPCRAHKYLYTLCIPSTGNADGKSCPKSTHIQVLCALFGYYMLNYVQSGSVCCFFCGIFNLEATPSDSKTNTNLWLI